MKRAMPMMKGTDLKMKKSKALGTLIAAIMITGAIPAVSAADYGRDPGYTAPSVPSNVGKPSDTGSGSTAGTPAKRSDVTMRSVTVALEKGTPVPIYSGKAAVKSNSIAQLAKKEGAVLTFKANRFTAEIASSSVTDPKNIDIGLEITKNTNRGALIIKTKQKGEYGCTVKYSVPAKIYEQAGIDLSTAAVYVVDRRTGLAEFYSLLELDDEGNIAFELYEGGSYIIL